MSQPPGNFWCTANAVAPSPYFSCQLRPYVDRLSVACVQSSVAAAAATLGNLKLGDSKAQTWSFDNFIDVVKTHRKDLRWQAVADWLDTPTFFVADAGAFSLLVSQTDPLPLHCFAPSHSASSGFVAK